MIKVKDRFFDLSIANDRQELHTLVDDIITDEVMDELIYKGESTANERLSLIHEYISDKQEQKLKGSWFDERVHFEYWINDITWFFEDMNIEYDILGEGCLEAYIDGQTILFTREEKPKSYYDGVVYTETGKITQDDLLKYGVELDNVYYLARDLSQQITRKQA